MRYNFLTGIYRITNTETGEVYIGQSKNITRRWHEHVKSLNEGTHHNYKLQNAYEAFGIMSFKFEVIKMCEEKDLELEEVISICEHNSINNGYNIAGEADGIKKDCISGIRGKFVVDIDGLINLGMSQATVFRYMYLYTQLATVEGRVGNQFGIKKIKDLSKYIPMSNTLFREFIKELKDLKLINISVTDGIYFDVKYIYKLKEWKHGIPNDCIIVYKDSLSEIYSKCSVGEHKYVGGMFFIHDCFKDNSCDYSVIAKKLCDLCTKPQRYISRWQHIKLKNIDIFKCYNGKCYMNTSMYHKSCILGNKSNIDTEFNNIENVIIESDWRIK